MTEKQLVSSDGKGDKHCDLELKELDDLGVEKALQKGVIKLCQKGVGTQTHYLLLQGCRAI